MCLLAHAYVLLKNYSMYSDKTQEKLSKNHARLVGVSSIGYTKLIGDLSREVWRFAKQIQPDLDCGKTGVQW